MSAPIRVGDLCVVVGDAPSNFLGAFCTVDKLEVIDGTKAAGVTFQRPMVWPFQAGTAPRGWVPQRNLKPIRDQPGTDETLGWKAVPKTDTLIFPPGVLCPVNN